jgi:hypothetical protein
MRVTFTKLDAKRYEVSVEREQGPALVPRPGPGQDARMPHDVEHFLVEEQFGITLGVFGQLAAGGSGIFYPAPDDNTSRAKQRAERIAALGRADMARSEELTRGVREAWERSTRGTAVPRGPVNVAVPDEGLAAAVSRMDEVSRAWVALPPGGALTMTWPARLTVRTSGTHRGRKADKRSRVMGRSR